MFKVESATVTTAQRIQIRKLLQKVGLTAKQGEELALCRSSWSMFKNPTTVPVAMPHGRRVQTPHRWMKSASPQAMNNCSRSTTSATNSATRSTPGMIWLERIEKRLPS